MRGGCGLHGSSVALCAFKLLASVQSMQYNDTKWLIDARVSLSVLDAVHVKEGNEVEGDLKGVTGGHSIESLSVSSARLATHGICKLDNRLTSSLHHPIVRSMYCANY
eukprot:SAG11_NODE_3976_length_2125_cov_5.330207_1_plen_108_part_00